MGLAGRTGRGAGRNGWRTGRRWEERTGSWKGLGLKEEELMLGGKEGELRLAERKGRGAGRKGVGAGRKVRRSIRDLE